MKVNISRYKALLTFPGDHFPVISPLQFLADINTNSPLRNYWCVALNYYI